VVAARRREGLGTRPRALEMLQDPTDNRRLGDEGDQTNLGTAAGTEQRIDFIDSTLPIRPSLVSDEAEAGEPCLSEEPGLLAFRSFGEARSRARFE